MTNTIHFIIKSIIPLSHTWVGYRRLYKEGTGVKVDFTDFVEGGLRGQSIQWRRCYVALARR